MALSTKTERKRSARKADKRDASDSLRDGLAKTAGIPERAASPARIPVSIVALAIALLVLGAALRLANLDTVLSRSPDEVTYTTHASALVKSGFAGTRALADAFLKDPEMQFHPPPTRIGFTALVAMAMNLTGIGDERAGAYVACWSSIAALGVALWIGLRFLGYWPALFGGLFLAVFPPDLVIARRCWSDALLGLTGILMFYFTMEIYSGRERWFFYLPLVLVGSGAVLVKETSILIYAPCLVIALWALLRKRDFSAAALLLGAAAACTILAVSILAATTGSVQLPLTIIFADAHSNALNPYAVNYQSGPPYVLLWAFGALSPLTSLLAGLGLVVTLVKTRRHDASGSVLLAWLTLGFIAIFMFVPHWMSLRYVSAGFAPLCLFAGSALWLAFTTAHRKLPFAGTGLITLGLAVVTVAMVFDYQRFDKAFVRLVANDLSVGVIRDALANARRPTP